MLHSATVGREAAASEAALAPQLNTIPRPLESSSAMMLHETFAVAFTAILFLGICVAYRKHGVSGIAAVTGQVAGIVVVQLSTKSLLNSGFHYPLCITSLQFLFLSLSMLALETYEKRNGKSSKFLDMLRNATADRASATWYLQRFGPVSALQCVNVVGNMSSLLYIGAGLNALVSIATPVVTALAASVFGKSIPLWGWMGIALAIAGDFCISVEASKAITFNKNMVWMGIGLAFLAMVARAIRTVLLDYQMNRFGAEDQSHKLSPIELTTFQAPLLAIFSFVLALRFEGLQPYKELHTLGSYALLNLVLSLVSALAVNVMGTVCIKILGASAAQIAGKLNVLVIVAFSCAFMGETLTFYEAIGAVVVLAGAGLFEHSAALPGSGMPDEKQKLQDDASKPGQYL